MKKKTMFQHAGFDITVTALALSLVQAPLVSAFQ